MKGIDTTVSSDVPTASVNRNRPVSPLKKADDILDQNKALSPNPAMGNAVAVPRWSGKFDAAAHFVSPWRSEARPRRPYMS